MFIYSMAVVFYSILVEPFLYDAINTFIVLCLLSMIAGSGFSPKKNGITIQGKHNYHFFTSHDRIQANFLR